MSLSAGGTHALSEVYCPEAWLARWFETTQGTEEPVWALTKVGVRPLRAALVHLRSTLGTDLIVLVDGGIDLILRGDETSIGTPAEDLATLAAVAGLPVASLAMCIGFGTELREGIPHAQVLERISELRRLGSYLGAIDLEGNSPGGAAYLAALEFVAAGQATQRGSHVHRTVTAAMRGEFGGEGDVWVSSPCRRHRGPGSPSSGFSSPCRRHRGPGLDRVRAAVSEPGPMWIWAMPAWATSRAWSGLGNAGAGNSPPTLAALVATAVLEPAT